MWTSVSAQVGVCVRAKYEQMYHNIFTVEEASLRDNNLQLNQRTAPPRERLLIRATQISEERAGVILFLHCYGR